MGKFVYILCAMQFALLAVFIYNIGMFIYLPSSQMTGLFPFFLIAIFLPHIN